MLIDNGIIKAYLQNVRFITGTAYAGKSTMVRMLAKEYGMTECNENYHGDLPTMALVTPEAYPNMAYFQTMRDWQEFIGRTPEAYEKWIYDSMEEIAAFEIAHLMHISAVNRVIVDTNIPIALLKEIAEPHQVAVMLSPMSMSVDQFFDREDADKSFILGEIRKAPSPEAAMANFRACLARINSQAHYDEYAGSGFFTMVRREGDLLEDRMQALAKHFRL